MRVVRYAVSHWSLAGTALVASLSLALVGYALHERAADVNHFARTAEQTHAALCTFRRDLESRYEGTLRYLREHPGPEPFPGVTRASIQLSLANQKRAVVALDDLKCP